MEKKYFINLVACLFMALGAFTFVACNDDKDEPVDEFGDYYIKFELVDKGTFTEAEANQLIGELNSGVEAQEGISKDQAIYLFDRVMRNLELTYSGTNKFEVSFRVKLMNKNSTVKSQMVKITRNGCTVS